MGVRYMKGDFQFPTSFGFSGSAQGRHDPRPHPVQGNDEYGPQGLADGGQPKAPPRQGKEPMVPLSTAVHAARGAAMLGARAGRSRGALQPGAVPPAASPALAGAAPMRGAVPTLPAARPTPVAPAQGQGPAMAPGMSEGGKFLQKGIKRPGRMKNLAARHGVSLGDEIRRDKHSSDPSLRAAANLGARLRSGDLSKKGK